MANFAAGWDSMPKRDGFPNPRCLFAAAVVLLAAACAPYAVYTRDKISFRYPLTFSLEEKVATPGHVMVHLEAADSMSSFMINVFQEPESAAQHMDTFKKELPVAFREKGATGIEVRLLEQEFAGRKASGWRFTCVFQGASVDIRHLLMDIDGKSVLVTMQHNDVSSLVLPGVGKVYNHPLACAQFEKVVFSLSLK